MVGSFVHQLGSLPVVPRLTWEDPILGGFLPPPIGHGSRAFLK